MRSFLVMASLLFALAASGSAVAEEQYFVTIYSAQRPIINNPAYTHTWANFVKLSRCNPTDAFQAESFTISWLPQTLDVKPWKLRSEPGVNLTCEKTLDWCRENRMESRQFGPFQIREDLYRMEYDRCLQFERGEKRYRASDILNFPGREVAVNCIYSVLEPVASPQPLRPVTLGFGYISGAYARRRFATYIIDDGKIHPWVNDLVGIPNVRQMRLGLNPLPSE